MTWPRGSRTYVSSRRRITVTVTCLAVAAACHVRVFLPGFSGVPPETEVGYVPLFLLAFIHALWWRQDDATGRYADPGHLSQ